MLIKDGEVIADPWRQIADDEPLPPEDLGGQRLIVSFNRLAQAGEHLPGAPFGVALRNTDAVEALVPHLAQLGVVVLDFPKFADGRAFTQARTLRQRLGYGGEIRARGPLMPDQVPFLLRCGFDTVETEDPRFLKQWGRALGALPAFYQRAG